MALFRAHIHTFAVVVCLTASSLAPQAPAELTREQIKQFLLTAKVVQKRHTSKGVTSPWRLTLTDGQLTHDASFQTVDEHKMVAQLSRGTTEYHFVDSYKYNIAAYELAELLGIGDMLPVTVERKWEDEVGSLTWWLPVEMDEADRAKQNLKPPDQEAWNKQVYRARVFTQLVHDTDPNQTNTLISKDWKLWRIDFTRAFREHKHIRDPKDLVRCDRQLLESLRKLDRKELEQKTKRYLTKWEIEAVMARRDLIVGYFQQQIAQRGEGKVLY